MVRFCLTGRDLANIRMAFSPLWESVAAFVVLHGARGHQIHAPWVKAVRGAANREDWTLLSSLVFTETGYLPDFIAPPPHRPLPRLEDELAQLVRTPGAVVRREIRRAYPRALPASVAPAMIDPAAFLGEVSRLLARFWRLALAPFWPRLRAALETEMAVRSRALALGGAEALFDGLHPRVRFRRSMVHIDVGAKTSTLAPRRGLLLVPSVFAWPDVFVVAAAPWRATLAYPAHGLAEIWRAPPVESRRALEALLGRTTSRLLQSMRTPATTLGLAHALKLTPGAVSQHLRRLHRAGLLERDRVGVRVYYSLAVRGRDLIEVLG